MSVQLIIDSGCELTAMQANAMDVILIPMTIHFGADEYRSGLDLSHAQFYARLATAKELPTTSQPTPYDFETVYRKVKEDGNQAVVLCISSALSGTYQSATIAADGYEDCIYVVDTRAVSVAQKLLLDYALTLREHGKTAKEIADAVARKKDDICAFGAVDTLEYLIKGGRLSKAAGTVGSMLGIRPVLQLSNGALSVAAKARGAKAAVTTTHKLIRELDVDFSMPIGIGYTGTDASVVEPFLAAADGSWAQHKVPVYNVGSTVGTHTGPGLFIVAFFKES